jgi:hypothetical protein
VRFFCLLRHYWGMIVLLLFFSCSSVPREIIIYIYIYFLFSELFIYLHF